MPIKKEVRKYCSKYKSKKRKDSCMYGIENKIKQKQKRSK